MTIAANHLRAQLASIAAPRTRLLDDRSTRGDQGHHTPTRRAQKPRTHEHTKTKQVQERQLIQGQSAAGHPFLNHCQPSTHPPTNPSRRVTYRPPTHTPLAPFHRRQHGRTHAAATQPGIPCDQHACHTVVSPASRGIHTPPHASPWHILSKKYSGNAERAPGDLYGQLPTHGSRLQANRTGNRHPLRL